MRCYMVEECIIQQGIHSIGVEIKIENLSYSDESIIFINQFQQELYDKYKNLQVSNIENLKVYRELHSYYRVNRKQISAPENLIRMLKRKKELPKVNVLVDIYNLVSAKYAIALGAHDLQKVKGNVILKETEGIERFIPLGKNEEETIPKGEYAYIDSGTNEILCKLEVKQCDKTKISEATKHALIIIQGNLSIDPKYIMEIEAELESLLIKYCRAKVVNKYYY